MSSLEGRRILVLNVSGIGDFVDSTPAVRILRNRAPRSRLTLLVSEKALPLAERCTDADEVLALPTSRARSAPSLGDWPRWLRRVASLRGRFDVVISLHHVSSGLGGWWLRLFLGWLGAPETVGRNTANRAPFFTNRLDEDDRPADQMERMAALVRTVGSAGEGGEPSLRPHLRLRSEEIEEARAFIHHHDWRGLSGPLVAVALGGERPTRRLPADRVETLVRLLQDKFAIRPVVWGKGADPGIPPSSGICHLDARGRFDLVRSAAVLAVSDLILTTYSAPQHLAGIWDKPTLVLVGPGDGITHRPHVSPGRSVMLAHSVPCAPCYHWACPNPVAENQSCLRGIAEEEVLRAFERLSHEIFDDDRRLS
ncbi:MAG: glycosyltransferase family 9 protein [Nitrospirae bacterium]|nr:glycosyltransferase family 9 protein [Nitrospirota bacterium]